MRLPVVVVVVNRRGASVPLPSSAGRSPLSRSVALAKPQSGVSNLHHQRPERTLLSRRAVRTTMRGLSLMSLAAVLAYSPAHAKIQLQERPQILYSSVSPKVGGVGNVHSIAADLSRRRSPPLPPSLTPTLIPSNPGSTRTDETWLRLTDDRSCLVVWCYGAHGRLGSTPASTHEQLRIEAKSGHPFTMPSNHVTLKFTPRIKAENYEKELRERRSLWRAREASFSSSEAGGCRPLRLA